MFVKCYNQKGEETGKVKLPDEIFNIEMNADLVHQIAVSQMANRRQATAHTKDRGDVRGGGKKPWRQKGTGRARHGSTRSPIWVGGGVAFGPTKEKSYKKIVPKKMRRKALFMVLSEKAKKENLIVLDSLPKEYKKTKQVFGLLEKLPSKGKSVLIGVPGYDKDIVLASRNIPKVKTIEARELNVADLLSFRYLLIPKESVKVIKETFLKA